MIALDISKSMLTEDVLPGKSRLFVAKSYIKKLIKELKGNKIGIVLFTNEAYLYQPLSVNHQLAIMSLDNVNTEFTSFSGTDLKKAIDVCYKSFDLDREIKKTIIVISDGENHENSPIQTAKNIKDKNDITINTIGIGTLKGDLMPIREEGKIIGYKKDNENKTITSKLQEQVLKDIALESKGSYTRANSKIINLDNIIKTINNTKKETDILEIYTKQDDQFQSYLIIGVLALV